MIGHNESALSRLHGTGQMIAAILTSVDFVQQKYQSSFNFSWRFSLKISPKLEVAGPMLLT
jgi:hypothetical protein